MAEELKVIVSADATQLTNGLNKATASLNTFKNASGQASTSLTNLSRVVSDAPYGFVGVANNINPLVESFGRLKAEAGSMGGAMKALAGQLMGGAGLGLAVSAVTSLLVVFTSKVGGAKGALSDAEKEQQKFNQSLQDAKQGALSTGFALQAYVDVAKNGQLPLEQRNEALKQANKILGEHGEKLTLANINTQKATESVNIYTKALIAQAVATKYTDAAASAQIKLTDLQSQLAGATNEVTASQANLSKVLSQNNRLVVASANAEAGAERNQRKEDAAINQLNTSKEKVIAINRQIAAQQAELTRIQNNLNKSTQDATAAFGQLGTKEKEDKGKKEREAKKKDIETILSLYQKYVEQIQDLGRIESTLGDNKLEEKIKTATSAIEKIVTDFNADPNNQYVLKIKQDLANFRRILPVGELELPLKVVPGVKPDDFKPLISNAYKQAMKAVQKDNSELLKQMQANADAVNGIIQNTFVGMADSFAQGIANLVTSGGSIGDFFSGIFSVISEGIIALGKQFVQMGIQIAIVKKFLIKNPLLAIAGGVALIAIGSILKSAMNKKSAFASGTTFAPGGMALVGERGPELLNIPKGSQVIPATQTARMMGAMESVQVYGILRGQDIYFSNKKYGQTYNRTS